MAGSVAIMKDERTYGVLVTAVGHAKMAAAVVRGEKVRITTAGVGDGGGAFYVPDEAQTALKREVWRGPVAGVEINVKSPNMVDARIVIPGNVGGWTVREAGLFDEDGDLIVLANYPETAKAIITEGISATLEILLHVLFTNVDAVSFQIDASMDTASVVLTAITIPAAGWSASGVARYPFTVDAPCGVALEFHFPAVALELGSLEIATACELCPTVRAINGAVQFWARNIPAAPMTGTVKLTRSGGSGGVVGDGSLPIATADTPGAVKPGDGLSVAADGTLSVDREKVLTDADLVNETEVAQAVADILN